MVSVVSPNPSGGRQLFANFFKNLDVNSGLKCKFDLIVKNSIRNALFPDTPFLSGHIWSCVELFSPCLALQFTMLSCRRKCIVKYFFGLMCSKNKFFNDQVINIVVTNYEKFYLVNEILQNLWFYGCTFLKSNAISLLCNKGVLSFAEVKYIAIEILCWWGVTTDIFVVPRTQVYGNHL